MTLIRPDTMDVDYAACVPDVATLRVTYVFGDDRKFIKDFVWDEASGRYVSDDGLTLKIEIAQ